MVGGVLRLFCCYDSGCSVVCCVGIWCFTSALIWLYYADLVVIGGMVVCFCLVGCVLLDVWFDVLMYWYLSLGCLG